MKLRWFLLSLLVQRCSGRSKKTTTYELNEMTVPAFLGFAGQSTSRTSTIPPSAVDRGDSWHLSSGSSGWHTHSTKGVSSAAMSALTLLVFLFFLNILQSCLQDMTYNQQPPPVVQVVSAPSAMREEGVTMMPMPVMVPMNMATPPTKRSGRKKRGDPRELSLVRKQYVQVPVTTSISPNTHRVPTLQYQRVKPTATIVPTTTERQYVPVPLVAPGHIIENRLEEALEEADGADEGEEDPDDFKDEPTVPPQKIIFVRPIVPIAASFRLLAWRALSAISRPLLPLLSLWRSGRDGDGSSSDLCCSMLMCELERIREAGGAFRTRLAQFISGFTSWSCPADSSLYHENSDCRALITECIERTGRQTTFTTLASLLERYVP